jgi:hypothetical protein
VKRKAIVIQTAEDGKREIAVDAINAKYILQFLEDKKLGKKFDLICRTILMGIKNTDLYDKENINDRCKNVTAMKFKGKLNARIYCIEQKQCDKTLVIIASELLESKKNQKNRQKENSLIEKVANYDYEIE